MIMHPMYVITCIIFVFILIMQIYYICKFIRSHTPLALIYRLLHVIFILFDNAIILFVNDMPCVD